MLELETGGRHTCATTISGFLHCWGDNNHGQLGIGGTTPAAQPNALVAISGVRNASLGLEHTCAVQTTGTVSCWGDNTHGQLGDGTSGNQRETPNALMSLSGVVSVTSGRHHTCALASTGTVFCWGLNDHGQATGIPGGAPVTSPFPVAGVDDAWAISAGGEHTCALVAGGFAKCWGNNEFGQLGLGTVGGDSAPGQVTGGFTGVATISAGDRHTCATRYRGDTYCWGHNSAGELGLNLGTSYFNSPRQIGTLGATEVISCGEDNTCARTNDGVAWCWGDNDSSALGIGIAPDSNAFTPKRVLCLP